MSLAQSAVTEQLLVQVRRFGDSIAEQHQCVARLKLHSHGRMAGLGNQADRKGPFREKLAYATAPEQRWRWMAGIYIFQIALPVENPEKQSGVAAYLRVLA